MRIFMGVHARLVLIAILLFFAHGGCSSESESAPRDVMATLESYHAALAAPDVSWVVVSWDARVPLRSDTRDWLAERIAAQAIEDVSAGEDPPLKIAPEWWIGMDEAPPDVEKLWIGIAGGNILLGRRKTGAVYDLMIGLSADELRDVLALLERTDD